MSDISALRRVFQTCLPGHPIPRQRAKAASTLLNLLLAPSLQRTALLCLLGPTQAQLIPRQAWEIGRLSGVSARVLHHRHFERAQRYVTENGAALFPGADICLFLPCHRTKPYSESPTIRAAVDTIRAHGLGQRVGLTVASVPGIVPLHLDSCYPFAYYDWDPRHENASIVRDYVATTERRAGAFVASTIGVFNHYVGYFRPRAAELGALAQALRSNGRCFHVVPHRATVDAITGRNRALWRFQGLKARVCLHELIDLLKTVAAERPCHARPDS